MKIKNVVLVILLVLAAGSGGWFLLKSSSALSAKQVQKDVYYCPMHPTYKSDRPGTCPICSMKLVKKEAPAATGSKKERKEICIMHNCPMVHDGRPCPMTVTTKEGEKATCPFCSKHLPEETSAGTDLFPGYSTVSLNLQKQQLIGVKTAPVVKKTLVKTIHAYGYVAHDLELYEAELEYIDAWHVYYSYVVRRPTKDTYREDWWQYYVKDPAQSRWRSDEKWKAQQRLVKAEYELVHLGLTPAQLEQLREIKYGQPWVQPDLVFFKENQPFWIYAQVLESDLGFIAPGQKVVATIPAYGETVEGVVINVAPIIDPVTRTSRVRIELPKYKGELSINMFVNVDMPVELDASLVVPREAVMDTGLNKIVFVQTAEGIFEPRTIQAGMAGDGMVAVRSGLKEGEIIVVSGNFLLDSESRLQGSLAGGHEHD